MPYVKKLLFIFLASAGALLAAGVLAAGLLAARPEWFLTAGSAARAARHFGGAYRPSWTSLDFAISSLSFRKKEIRLRALDLCFENAELGAEGCIKELDVRLNVRLYFFGARVEKISRLRVLGDHFKLDPARGKPRAAKKKAGPPAALQDLLPSGLSGFAVEELNIDLPGCEIKGAGGTLRGRLRLELPPGGTRPLALKLEVASSSGTLTRHYSGEGTLDSDLLKGKEFTYLDAAAALKGGGVNALLRARAGQSGPGAMAFGVTASARLPGRRAEADFEGSLKGRALALKGKAGLWESAGPVKSVQLKSCTLEVGLKEEAMQWDTLKFEGRFEVEPQTFGLKRARLNLASRIEGRLAVSARSTPQLLAADHFDAEVSAAVKPAKDWYSLYGTFSAGISGRASRVRELKIAHRFNFGLKVAGFEDLVEYLAHSPYSVPAPVHVLRGPLAVSVKGSGDPRKGAQEFDYEIASGLAAGRQALKFRVNGKLSAVGLWAPDRAFSNDTEMILEDIALQLPRFDLRGMAALQADSRIQSGAKADKRDLARREGAARPAGGGAAPLNSRISVKTVKPVLLYSNLAKDPVPVGLDLTVSPPRAGMEGTAELKPFRALIFRRIAAVDHVRLTGRAGSDIMDLDGLIVYKTSEASIRIRLLGTSLKPRVELESDPPMSQDDLMALLLFGKAPGQLDSDQQASAANASSAVAGSAFGLASLYLLASTPVDYVGYDPASRTYTVKLRLPGGATLQLGSNGASRGVQLRKRLAANLAIQTELTSTETQGNVVTTLLEWYGRR